MGTLRTLLAIAVVFAHTPLAIRIFGGGRVAVQMFYAISGFLITFVLENVKAYQNPRRFYENRALRIFPVYCAVLAMSAVVAFVFSTQMASFRQLPFSAQTLRAAAGRVAADLRENEWLAGDRFTLADIAVYPHLAQFGTLGLAVDPAVDQWLRRVAARPSVQAIAADLFPLATMGPEPGRWG